MKRLLLSLALVVLFLSRSSIAEVTRVEIKTRANVGNSGYEKIVGTLHFALAPSHPRNAVIVDLDRATTNAEHRVEFSADLFILRPKDEAKSNGVALIEVSNRGGKGLLSSFARASGGRMDPSNEADLGDGFLTTPGYTLVWVGWQFDIARAGAVGLSAPIAKGVSSLVRTEFTLNTRSTETVLVDFAGYSLEPDSPVAELTVRDGPYGKPERIARTAWSRRDKTLTLTGGFEPGRTYEFTTRAMDVPVAGAGLAAFRDTAAWLKYDWTALAHVRHAIAFGSSQSGRFLRTFLYYGFNSDEQDRRVFDGVMAHIAGSARLSLNERGARPNALKAPSPAFPFADAALRDPVSGKIGGLLDNDRARQNQPKIFYTNTSVEYWGSDRLAALIHTSPDGRSDLTTQENVRIYFLTGTQHGPSAFPPPTTTGQQPSNPVEYRWTLRALLTAMTGWVKNGTLPPASQHPRLADGTLVPSSAITFPSIAGVPSPRDIPGGREGTTLFPFLVPAIDADGNERSGVRTAELVVPVATYTGWNFRNQSAGGTDYLVSLTGSSIPFARSAAERKANNDPRPSIAERYPSKEHYLARAKAECDRLIAGGYLLSTDAPQVMKRIEMEWPAGKPAAVSANSRAQP